MKFISVFNKGSIVFGLVFLMFCGLISSRSLGQEKKRIDIHADWLENNEKIVANAQRWISNVVITHNTITMWCDSAYSYEGQNVVDAFGRVHILKDDTLHLYADFIHYDGDRKFAKARRNVKLVNKETTLITDSLNFDMAANVGFYDNFATITDSTNVLTSLIGQYYTKTDKVHFKKDVIATTKKYRMFSDTLIYNVTSKTAFIVGPTRLEDDSTKLYTEKGWYNSITGETRLLKKPNINTTNQHVKADSIYYKKEDDGFAFGKVEIEDFKNRMIVKGNRIVFNELKKTSIVTDSALYIQYSEKDSLFMHADTLRTRPDTTAIDAKLVQAYFKVKFYRNDLQGKCDSLVYWTKDSTIQLYNKPVIWTGGNQLSARFIQMNKNTGKPDEVKMLNDAFIIAMEPDSISFNQIKGKNMTGYIRNNELYKINVDGNGQSLYYARDTNGTIGLNKAESSSITIWMEKNKVKKISFISKPEGILKPMLQIEEPDTKLPGFDWMELIRPKEILDIFRK